MQIYAYYVMSSRKFSFGLGVSELCDIFASTNPNFPNWSRSERDVILYLMSQTIRVIFVYAD